MMKRNLQIETEYNTAISDPSEQQFTNICFVWYMYLLYSYDNVSTILKPEDQLVLYPLPEC